MYSRKQLPHIWSLMIQEKAIYTYCTKLGYSFFKKKLIENYFWPEIVKRYLCIVVAFAV